MRLQNQVYLWIAVLFSGFFALGLWLSNLFPDNFRYAQVGLVTWCLLCAVVQYHLIRCPHCGRLATIRPSGVASPDVGSSCRYCNREY